MGVKLPMLVLWSVSFGPIAGANEATDRIDEVSRAQPESYAQGWTNNLTFCADDMLNIQDGEFLRTTKAAGYRRLLENFEVAKSLGLPLGPPYVAPGEQPPPPEGPCALGALARASSDLTAMAAVRESLLAASAALACEGKELSREDRDALALKGAQQIKQFEPLLTRALRDARTEASPRVRGLISGTRKLDKNAEEGFSRCEGAYWSDYRELERLSCQLFVMKSRMEYLHGANAAGEMLAYGCFNDAPPAKPEHEDSGQNRVSEVTGTTTN